MAGRNTLLTPELTETIAGYIRQGAWDYVAAESAGVSQRTFYQWLSDADLENPDPAKTQFSQAITQARADARRTAEALVFADKPDKWLLQGPGRHKPGRDGWTSESSVTVHSDAPVIALAWDGKIQSEDGDQDPDD